MKQLILNIVFLLFSTQVLFSQETVLSAGRDANGSGGSASYSVGQVVYITNFGVSASIAQGVQQPYEISIISEVIESNIYIGITAYPNPTRDFLTLKIENLDLRNLSYEIYNIEGKLVDNNLIKNKLNLIKISSLPKSIYFLKVLENEQAVKTFKIIKN